MRQRRLLHAIGSEVHIDRGSFERRHSRQSPDRFAAEASVLVQGGRSAKVFAAVNLEAMIDGVVFGRRIQSIASASVFRVDGGRREAGRP
jgi:hypothetical protein